MYKRKEMMKRFSILLVACAMLCTSIAHVMADNETMDASKKGSLTLHKYEGDPLSDVDAHTTQNEMATKVNEKVTSGDLKPMAGITFHYLPIGSVGQYTKKDADENTVTKIGYTIDDSLKTFLNLQAVDVDATVNGKSYYTPKALGDKLATKTQAQSEAYMQKNHSIAMAPTNNAGLTTQSDLVQGLYMIVEVGYPTNTVKTTEPFLVSLPMSDTDANGQSHWIYDVNAYPKNKTGDINIDTVVLNKDGNESKLADDEIGESQTFKIRADVMANVAKTKKYTIQAILDAGMTYQGAYSVTGVKKDGSEVPLTAGQTLDTKTSYTFKNTGQNLIFDFDPTMLGQIDQEHNDAAVYDHIDITYKAALNDKAIVGSLGNHVTATLEHSTNTNVQTQPDTTTIEHTSVNPCIYTYAIDLYKFGDSDINKPLQGVHFQLLRQDDKTNVDLAKTDTGTYYLNENVANTSATIASDQNGKALIQGLSTGTYYLKETHTVQGYNLLSKDIALHITSNEWQYQKAVNGTFAKVEANEKYYTDANKKHEFVLPSADVGKYVNFPSSTIYNSEGKAQDMYQPQELHATSAPYRMGNDGKIILKIDNTKGFQLPLTGGSGTFLFTVGGGALIIFAGVIMLFNKKKGTQQNK